MPIATVNPTTGALVRSFDEHDDAHVDRALSRARDAAATWRRATIAERTALLHGVADALERDRERLAALATLEMGKTVQAARDEVAKCAFACRYYAAHAEPLLAPEPLHIDGADAVLHFQPLGVLLAVMPWNFPFWQVVRAAAPAILAGNVVVLKHASNVPQCALALEALVAGAGAPPGVFQTLLVSAARTGAIVEDARVAAVTLTGSEAAGRDVAAHAGRAIKKTVLELGGSDPFVVLADADLALAASNAVKGRMINNGQSCIAAKRFIVVEAVADEFESRFIEFVRALRVGDPMDPATDVGPLATRQIRDELASQVERSVRAGARLAVGGGPVAGPGFFYAPTVLTGVPLDAPALTEELFGPVAPVVRVRDTDEAIARANATAFGLGASVWTRSGALADRATDEIDAGMVFVNTIVASDPRFPFGGVKASGYGREVGLQGLREFVNVKTVRGSA
ncbi:MAG: NAD-dependent succinate-semialdehyde dehydrogenase [Gemmatimonadetes bacterium]|nr:NAD-dependent succinate-semialdehyde dehydrogenase [Gemmatimonadota bacterium]MBI3567000.1 NAD-dependent succinate-semialdehyde dehydrogenase [Gemmatimonadota bacterium]